MTKLTRADIVNPQQALTIISSKYKYTDTESKLMLKLEIMKKELSHEVYEKSKYGDKHYEVRG